MRTANVIILLLLFIFVSLYTVFGEENTKNSILESAKKAGFEKPVVTSCPSCKEEIVVDLSVKTSQCPYCKEIFLSESAVKRIEDKEALPYAGSIELTTSESEDKGALKEIVYDEKYGDTPKGFYLYINFDGSLSKRAEVDLSKVFDGYQKTKKFNRDLEKKADIKQEQRKKLVKEIKRIRQDIVLEGSELETSQEIKSKIHFLQQFDETAKAELIKERDEMVRDVLIVINNVIQKYGKDNKYKAIYNDKVPHIKEKDISKKIINILNASYE